MYGNDPEIFSISIMEKVPEFRNDFRNDFFSVNRKFPERCSGIPDRYGIPERSGISGTLRNVPEISGMFWNIVPEIFRKNRSGNFRNNWYQN